MKILQILQSLFVLIYEAVHFDDQSLITIFVFIANRRHRATPIPEEERILQKLLEKISPLLVGAELSGARAGAEA